MPLTDAKLRTLTKPGKHFDGGGLYLELTKAGGRYWRLKYRHAGKENRLALGVYPDVGLKDARDKADAARKLIQSGTDPAAARAGAAAMHPLGRLGEPSDIASAFVYLASDDASWVTGTGIHVDGGLTTGLWGG